MTRIRKPRDFTDKKTTEDTEDTEFFLFCVFSEFSGYFVFHNRFRDVISNAHSDLSAKAQAGELLQT